MSIVNFNNTTPAAPGGNTNITFQQSGTSVSAYVPNSAGSNVIGTAVFSASGGSISNATYKGVVSSVTRSATGSFTCHFTAAQSNYCVAITATDNNTAAVFCYVGGNSFATLQSSASTFPFFTMSCPSGVANTLQDCAVVTLIICQIP